MRRKTSNRYRIRNIEEKPKRGRTIVIVFLVLIGLWLVSTTIGALLSLDTDDNVAIIPLYGPIMSGAMGLPFASEGLDSQDILDFIEDAEENENVKAIILEINSPGGTVVASKEIASAVRNAEKPVIAWIREIGTSGAYWVASASDYIIADELSLTGSIGVNGGYLEFSGLMEEYGVGYEQLIAGEHKDVGNLYEELDSKERKLIQDKLDIIHEVFIDSIAYDRGLEVEAVKKFADGFYYLGNEALEAGLIDALGGKEEAIAMAEELSGVEELEEVMYEREEGLFDMFDKLSVHSSYQMGRGIGDSFVAQRNGFSPRV